MNLYVEIMERMPVMKMLPPPADAQKAMHIAVGAASPLWLIYGGAMVAGATLYWMNRWRDATNLEAMLGALKAPTEAAVEVTSATAEVVEAAVEAVVEPIVDAMPEPLQQVVAAIIPEPVATEPDPVPDDLTVLVGIGPKLAAALADRGIIRYADIARLTPRKIAKLDQEMRLMGRIDRDAWVAQAKRLVEA